MTDIRLVVLQRGWVVVGHYIQDGDHVTISDAKVIERWGTTKGLGELVAGPTDKTVLRPGGVVETHILGVVFTIRADAAAWMEHLA